MFHIWSLGTTQIIIVNFVSNLTLSLNNNSISYFYHNLHYFIYLITCKNWPIQYVWETGETLRNRFNLHKSSFRNSQKIDDCKIVRDHNHKLRSKSSDYIAQVIEALPENTTATVRQNKETELMLKLQTTRSGHPEVFLRKSVLKICSKFTGKHSCQSVISIKLQSTLIWALSCKFAGYFQNTFS